MVIFGLRRTGKTVLMEQILSEYGKPEECAYLLVDPKTGVDGNQIESVSMSDIENVTCINNIQVYNIDALATLKI